MAAALVIFDCDGVLVDSEPISNTVLAHALTAAGLPTTPEQSIERFKGRIMPDIVQRVEAQLGRPLPGDFVERFEADRADVFTAELEPMPGATDTVRALRDAGVPVAVASQGTPANTEHKLAVTGLRGSFEDGTLFSAYDVPRGKPFPDVYLHAAAGMGVAPERCLVVEDTVIGVTAAVSAGMRVLGLVPPTSEAGAAEALRAAGAEPIRALAELLSRAL